MRLHASAPADILYPKYWPSADASTTKKDEKDAKVASAPAELATLEQLRPTRYSLNQRGWKKDAYVEWTDKTVYKIIAQEEDCFNAKLVNVNVSSKCVVRINFDYLLSKENKWKVKDPKTVVKKCIVDFSPCRIAEAKLVDEVKMQFLSALGFVCRKPSGNEIKLASLANPTALVAESAYQKGALKLPPVTQRVSTTGGKFSLGELLQPPQVEKPVEFWLQPSLFEAVDVHGESINTPAPFF